MATESRVTLSFRVSPALYDRLKALAYEEHRSVNNLLHVLATEGIEAHRRGRRALRGQGSAAIGGQE
jgi:hypothetical protein